MTPVIIVLIILGGAGSFFLWQYAVHRQAKLQKAEERRKLAETKAEQAEVEKAANERNFTEQLRANPFLYLRQKVISFFRGAIFYQYIAAKQTANAEKERLTQQYADAKQDFEDYKAAHSQAQESDENEAAYDQKNSRESVFRWIGCILWIGSTVILFNMDSHLIEVISSNLEGKLPAGAGAMNLCLTVSFMIIFALLGFLLHVKTSSLTGARKRAGTVGCYTGFVLALTFLLMLAPARAEYMHQTDIIKTNRQVLAAEEKHGEGTEPWTLAREEQSMVEKKVASSSSLFILGTISAGAGEFLCAKSIFEAIVFLRILQGMKRRRDRVNKIQTQLEEVDRAILEISTDAEFESREFGDKLRAELEKAGVPNYADVFDAASRVVNQTPEGRPQQDTRALPESENPYDDVQIRRPAGDDGAIDIVVDPNNFEGINFTANAERDPGDLT